MKKLIYLLFITSVLLGCSKDENEFTFSDVTTKTTSYTANQWMKNINDETSIKKLTIPGTHDSGARYGGILAECQNMTITKQLNSGIRFLDIRCKLKDGKLKIYHGIMNQYADLDDVLNECITFLNENKDENGLMTEGLIMSIKNEDGGDDTKFSAAVDEYISRTSEYWHLGTSVPTIGGIRGKIALFRRYSSSDKGINMSSGWADNATFTIKDVRVQDKYTVSSTSKIVDKWSAVESLLNESQNNKENDLLYVNFCSGTGLWGTYPKFVAWGGLLNKGILQYLETYLRDHISTQGMGCILMDFPTESLIASLIESNF